MLLTNHVLSGALIGAVVRRPAAAFAIGVAVDEFHQRIQPEAADRAHIELLAAAAFAVAVAALTALRRGAYRAARSGG